MDEDKENKHSTDKFLLDIDAMEDELEYLKKKEPWNYLPEEELTGEKSDDFESKKEEENKSDFRSKVGKKNKDSE